MMNKFKFSYIWYWILVVLPIYQDSPLAEYLGSAGYTFVLPFSYILLLGIVLFCNKGKINIGKENRGLFILGAWILLTSFFAIAIWGILGNPLTVLGEFLPTKAVKVCVQYMSFPIYVSLLIYCIKDLENEQNIYKPVFFSLVILTIIVLLEIRNIPYAFENLHFSGILPYYRVRLLTMESSSTALLIFVYGGISIYYGIAFHKRFCLITAFVCVGILLLTTGSKSLMIASVAVLVTYCILVGKRLNKKTIISIVIVGIISLLSVEVVYPKLIGSLKQDLYNYTSIATRTYTLLIGLGIGVIYPFGVGGGVYLGIYQAVLKQFLPIVTKLPIHLNVTEIESLAYRGTDVGLTVKSGILHYNMYWGIIGTIYLLKVFWELVRRVSQRNVTNNEILRAIFIVAVGLLFFASDFQYEFWLLYAILCGTLYFKDGKNIK